uniref:peptidoglycan-binding domain-containing protein n=1 Tax=Streptomyces sp. YIM 98790 TaxID=2689077 RepID=UPI001A9E35E7
RRRTRLAVLAAAVATTLALLAGGGYAVGVFGDGKDGTEPGQAAGSGGAGGTGGTEDEPGPGGGDAAPAVPGTKPSDDESPSDADEETEEPAEEAEDPGGTDDASRPDDNGSGGHHEADGQEKPQPEPTASERPDPEPSPTQSASPRPTQSTSSPDPGAPGRKHCNYAADRNRAWAQGHAGESVKEIQCLLNYNYGYRLDVDGIFGPLTDDAVRSVQRCSGIAVDGEVGPDTWSHLDNPKPSCV